MPDAPEEPCVAWHHAFVEFAGGQQYIQLAFLQATLNKSGDPVKSAVGHKELMRGIPKLSASKHCPAALWPQHVSSHNPTENRDTCQVSNAYRAVWSWVDIPQHAFYEYFLDTDLWCVMLLDAGSSIPNVGVSLLPGTCVGSIMSSPVAFWFLNTLLQQHLFSCSQYPEQYISAGFSCCANPLSTLIEDNQQQTTIWNQKCWWCCVRVQPLHDSWHSKYSFVASLSLSVE